METHLKNYLTSKLRAGKDTRALFGDYGPLSTFAACIGVGYATNLLHKCQRDDLASIARIRNHFAHDPYEAEFLDAEVTKYLNKVTSFDPFHIQGQPLTAVTARARYLEACGIICAQLTADPVSTKATQAEDA